VTPGRDFGVHGADAMLRFAYAANASRLREALTRIAAFL
jgi:aspartate/methionine/tyrosine aminotransferase